MSFSGTAADCLRVPCVCVFNPSRLTAISLAGDSARARATRTMMVLLMALLRLCLLAWLAWHVWTSINAPRLPPSLPTARPVMPLAREPKSIRTRLLAFKAARDWRRVTALLATYKVPDLRLSDLLCHGDAQRSLRHLWLASTLGDFVLTGHEVQSMRFRFRNVHFWTALVLCGAPLSAVRDGVKREMVAALLDECSQRTARTADRHSAAEVADGTVRVAAGCCLPTPVAGIVQGYVGSRSLWPGFSELLSFPLDPP